MSVCSKDMKQLVGRQKVSVAPSYNAKVGRPAIRECCPRNRFSCLIKRRVIKRRGGLAALWNAAKKIG